jgi:antitoxin ParD1/3/4
MADIERLTITLPADMARRVKGAVDDGDYASSSEVIREALRDWKMKRELRSRQLAELKADIDRGCRTKAAMPPRPKQEDKRAKPSKGRKGNHTCQREMRYIASPNCTPQPLPARLSAWNRPTAASPALPY